MGCHFLLQEIFPTQGSNLGLPYCRQTHYHLSQQGSDNLRLRFSHVPSLSQELPAKSNFVLLLLLFSSIFFFFLNFWLHWVFIAGLRLSLVAASGDYPSLQCASFSLRWLLSCVAWVLGHSGSVVVARGLRCSISCEVFPDQGLSLYPLHW